MPPILPFSIIGIAGRPNSSVRTTVLHCFSAIYMSSHFPFTYLIAKMEIKSGPGTWFLKQAMLQITNGNLRPLCDACYKVLFSELWQRKIVYY